jgi:hypothetical protein
MKRVIDVIKLVDVVNQLSYRKERHIFCKDIADVAIPVMRSFGYKKATKRIITAVNKALKNNPKTIDVSATLCDLGRKQVRFESSRKSDLFEPNGYGNVLMPLLKWDQPFYLSLGTTIESDIVGNDLYNTNERFCDLSIFFAEIDDYDFAIKDAPRLVENNNNLCELLKKHNDQIGAMHKQNQWVFRTT